METQFLTFDGSRNVLRVSRKWWADTGISRLSELVNFRPSMVTYDALTSNPPEPLIVALPVFAAAITTGAPAVPALVTGMTLLSL